MKGELTGKCACGAVTYLLREGMRLNPYACHCTECQARTGSAFSEHMLFIRRDLKITGQLDVGTLTQPSGAKSSISGCAICKSLIFAENNQREGFASLRCGTLDNSIDVVPKAHLWVQSKQKWVLLPADAVKMDRQPETNDEWLKFIGLVQ